jgi:hypothetical protein
MKISVSREEARVPVTILHLDGALTTEEELEEAAQREMDDGARYLLVDLAKVPYMATAGLRALHSIYESLRDLEAERSDDEVRKGISSGTYASAHLKLLSPTEHTLETLRTAGYDMFLDIYKDRKKALAAF